MCSYSIAVGSDHGGFELKERVIAFLKEEKHIVTDFGTTSDNSVDYPDFADKVSKSVSQDRHNFGILICGTGVGMDMSANKIRGIRAANCTNTTMARLSRQHNDANILCIGARTVGEVLAKDIIISFLSSEFEGGRHKRRVNKINKLEENNE